MRRRWIYTSPMAAGPLCPGFFRLERSRKGSCSLGKSHAWISGFYPPEDIHIHASVTAQNVTCVKLQNRLRTGDTQPYLSFGAISPQYTPFTISNDKVAVSEGSNAPLAGFQLGKHPATSAWGAGDVDVSTEDKDGSEFPSLAPRLRHAPS